MIFGLALFYYVVERVRWEQLMSACSPVPCYPGDHNYLITEPFELFIAACALLPNKWWSHAIAFLISGNVLKSYTFNAMHGYAAAHDDPLLSWATLAGWWRASVYEAPQISIYLGLGAVIFLCATALLVRKIFRETQGDPQHAAVGKGQSLASP